MHYLKYPHKLSYILLKARADATGYESYIRHESDIILGVGGSSVGHRACLRHASAEGHRFESRCSLLTTGPQ